MFSAQYAFGTVANDRSNARPDHATASQAKRGRVEECPEAYA